MKGSIPASIVLAILVNAAISVAPPVAVAILDAVAYQLYSIGTLYGLSHTTAMLVSIVVAGPVQTLVEAMMILCFFWVTSEKAAA